MARRILFALLGLVIAVVTTVTVLLAVNATGYDRSTFITDTKDTLRSYAAVEQSVLSCGGDAALLPLNQELNSIGDHLEVLSYNAHCDKGLTNHIYWNGGVPTGDRSMLLSRARAADPKGSNVPSHPVAEEVPGWVVAAIAVDQTGNESLGGYVLLARSTSALDSEVTTLWTVLGAAAIAGLVGATLIAIWLARWTSKPLAGLDTVARRLADGDLSVRAKPDYGPPEVRRLARTFNTMAGRLENLVHGSRAVLADVSHQLRTPLAALRLRLDFLAAEAAETDEEMAAELNGAQDEVTRLSRLVDGLLAVARAENVQPQPKVIDVAEVAEERVAAWQPVAEDRGILLRARYNSAVPGWLGEGHLEQVLDNLIDNALEALSAGDRIQVSASQSESGVRVLVRDSGPGMSPEMRERAFLRFSSDSPGGTGIGLAIVQRLVTANGGTVHLEDSPGGGLTVVLEFPAAPTQAEDDTADLPRMGNTTGNTAGNTAGNAGGNTVGNTVGNAKITS